MSTDAMPVSEAQLLAQRRWVRDLARRLVRDWDQAADLEQQAYLAALEGRPRIRRSLRAWLVTVMRNQAASGARSDIRRSQREERVARAEATPPSDELVARAEIHQRVVNAVMALEEPYRTTILFRYFGDLTPTAIAEQIGAPLETVRTRLKRAHHQLRQALAAEQPDGPEGCRRALAVLAPAPLVSAVGTGFLGVLLMSAKSKAIVVAAVVLLAGSSIAVWKLALQADEEVESNTSRHGASPEPGPILRGQDAPGEKVPEPAEDDPGLAALHGRVLDEKGRPVPDVLVEVRTWRPAPELSDPAVRHATDLFAPPEPLATPTATATTATDGTFLIHGLAGDSTQRIRARPRPPFVGQRKWLTTPAGETTEVVLSVTAGTPLHGQVVTSNGTGVRATVSLALAVPRAGEGWAGPWREGHIATAADGSFSLSAVPSGQLRATVHVPGRSKHAGLTVRTPHKGTLRLLVATEDGAVIQGRVIDSAGHPVVGARVAVTTKGTEGNHRAETTRMTSTDAGGHYRIEHMDSGRFSEIVVVAPGFAVHRRRPYGREVTDDALLVQDVTLFEGTRLIGTVRDVHGAPIEGARVIVAYLAHRPRVTRVARTDALGAYVLERLPLTTGEMWVLADGYFLPGVDDQPAPPSPAQYGRGLALPAAQDSQETRHDVTLEPGIAVRGQVVDTAGQPVSRARVRARNLRKPAPAGARGASRIRMLDTTADDAGRFAFAGLAPRPDWLLSATSRGLRAVQEVAVTTVRGARGPVVVEIHMQASASIAGRVLMPDGSPAAQTEVGISGAARSRATDQSGAFRFDDLAPGTYDVYLSANRSSRPVGETTQIEVVEGREVDDVVLHVAPESEISGVLVDEKGKPLAGVFLSARSDDGNRWWDGSSILTEEDGTFRFRNLRGGFYHLDSNALDLKTRVEGGQHGVRVVFRRTLLRTIHGEIRRPDGEVVPSVTLSVAIGSTSGEGQHIYPSVTGAFRLTVNVGPGPLSIMAWGARDGAGRRLNLRPASADDVDDAEPIVLTMKPGRLLRGKVVDDDGQGIPDVRVRLRRHATRDDSRAWVGYGDASDERSGPDGSFAFTGLYDGRVTLAVGAVPGWLGPKEVTIEPDQDAVLITLRRAAAIGGRVTDEEGRPLRGVRVTVWQRTAQGGRQNGTATGADGSFRVEGIPAGGTIAVTAGPITIGDVVYEAARRDDVRPGTLDLVLRLTAGRGIRGIVVGPDGEPVTDAMVEAVDADDTLARLIGGRLIAASTQLRGGSNAFVLGPLKAGEYVLSARPLKGPYSVSEPIRVISPANDVRIVLRKGHVLEGHVADMGSRRFRAFWLRPDGKDGWTYRYANCDTQGRFRLESLAPERGRLFVHRDGDDRMAYLEDVDPARGDIEIELQRGSTIEGTVPVKGTPRVTDIRVYARRDGLSWAAGSVKANGSFTLRGLPPGAYIVSTGRNATKAVEVQAGASGVVLERTN